MSTGPSVTLELPDGRVQVLVPGDVIGRTARAALRIDDPRISEGHAMISLRGADLMILALRGRLSVHGHAATEARLTPGARILLAGVVPLRVGEVALPDKVFALELRARGGEWTSPVAVNGVAVVEPGPPPCLVARFDPQAAVTVWDHEHGVFFRFPGRADALAGEGAVVALDDELEARVAHVPLSALGAEATADVGRFDVSLTVLVHYDTVHVRPSSGASVVFDGLLARILSEVAALSTPVAWLPLARLVWKDEDDEHILRYRWDQAVSRIRKKLRAGRIRSDLLRSTGVGLVELMLGPHDRVEDHS